MKAEIEKILIHPPIDLIVRFDTKILKDATSGCWNWVASLSDNGYGKFGVGRNNEYSHRVSYVLNKGKIPAKKDIHHICENKRCVNPEHLVAVTRKHHLCNLSPKSVSYKNLRKTHCAKGHLLSGKNLDPSDKNCRRCIICRRNKANRLNKKYRLQRGITPRPPLRKINFNGETKLFREWVKIYRKKYNLVYDRFYLYGWTFKRSLLTP